jgi:type 1 glutamine amidotransferase
MAETCSVTPTTTFPERLKVPNRLHHIPDALSYIQREGKGRVFVEVLGHDESIYKMPSMLAHILAGVQYAIGDLQADDSPTNPAKP